MTIRTVLLLLFFTHSISVRSEQPLVVGYLPEYRIDDVNAEHLRPLTDLIYFGLTPPADVEEFSPVIPESTLTKLKEIKRVAECRLLICIGGWNRSDNFSALAADSTSRSTFISRLATFCEDNELDGVDFDWEHPSNVEEIRNYAQLLQESCAAFEEHNLMVTVAQAGWQDLGKRAYAAVDRVHLMAYDHKFPQATMMAAEADVDRILRIGCPQNKVVRGAPFYGRNAAGAARTYRELVTDVKADSVTDVINGFALNGPGTIAKKIGLARRKKISGIMIWEVGQDSANPATSLLSVIAGEVSGRDNQQH